MNTTYLMINGKPRHIGHVWEYSAYDVMYPLTEEEAHAYSRSEVEIYRTNVKDHVFARIKKVKPSGFFGNHTKDDLAAVWALADELDKLSKGRSYLFTGV